MVIVFGGFAIIDGITTLWSAFIEAGPTPKWPTVLLGGRRRPHRHRRVRLARHHRPRPALHDRHLGGHQGGAGRSWGWIAAAGALAVVFGLGVMVHPGAGAVAVVALIATVAVAVGVSFIAAAISLEHVKHVRTESAS
jgi:uncharacterized membrane protein HdeD (DUF308 family)